MQIETHMEYQEKKLELQHFPIIFQNRATCIKTSFERLDGVKI